MAKAPEGPNLGKRMLGVWASARQLTGFAPLFLRWWWRLAWALAVAAIKRRFGVLRRGLLVAWCLLCGFVALNFGAAKLDPAPLSDYLIQAAVMIGGTAAIVFSITLVLVQNVSDLYSSRHFNKYVNAWDEIRPFVFIVAIAIALLSCALYVGAQKALGNIEYLIIVLSLVLIGVVFALIDLQFEGVRRKLRPAEFIAFLRDQGLAFARRTKREAERIADLVRALRADAAEGASLAMVYNRLFGPAITDLSNQIELLVDIAVRLEVRHELETAKIALSASGDVVCAYIDARKASSILLPSKVMLVPESDSRPFLASYLEHMNRSGVRFVRDGQEGLASHVVDVYRALARTASGVHHSGGISENPILDQVMWSLNSFARGNDGATNEEVMFQAAAALGEIAALAAGEGLYETVFACEENLHKLTALSFAYETTTVASEATRSFFSILCAIFKSQELARDILIDRAVEGIAQISTSLSLARAQGTFVINDPFVDTAGYDLFGSVLNNVFQMYRGLSDVGAKRRYRHDILHLFEKLRSQFRAESNQIAADSLTAGSIGRLVATLADIVISLLHDDEFREEHGELRKLFLALTYTPYWFLDATRSFRTNDGQVPGLADVVASMGIKALIELSDRDFVLAAIAALDAMAKRALERASDANGYGDARVLENACYIGILSMKVGWMDIVTDLKSRIEAFQLAYGQKYFPNGTEASGLTPEQQATVGAPFGNQIRRDLENVARSFDYEKYNGIRLGRDPRELLYDRIDEADIRAFVDTIWRE